MLGADNPCRCCPEVLAQQFPFFLHAPNKTFKNLEKSVSGCHPKADEATREGNLEKSVSGCHPKADEATREGKEL